METATFKSLDIKKWAKRRRRSQKSQSNGGGSSQDGPDGDQVATSSPISPRTLFNQPPLQHHQVPPSPYLSEEAHVHSLQHPPVSPSPKDDVAGWLAPKHRRVSSSNIPHMPLLEEASPGASASESRSVFPNLPWRKNSIARLKIKEVCGKSTGCVNITDGMRRKKVLSSSQASYRRLLKSLLKPSMW
jgi:hypothetical protein